MKYLLVYWTAKDDEGYPGLRADSYDTQTAAIEAYVAMMDHWHVSEARLYEVTMLAEFRKSLLPDYVTGKQLVASYTGYT